ncbi:hypothetical protein CRENBAI_008102 [Crenichthys baileyi]|uniref:Uncharacterized protein n=1 Tax=Crenichthys baileyi TaxID=28760 RepID=A0AAV9RUJ4_9TELE
MNTLLCHPVRSITCNLTSCFLLALLFSSINSISCSLLQCSVFPFSLFLPLSLLLCVDSEWVTERLGEERKRKRQARQADRRSELLGKLNQEGGGEGGMKGEH